MKNNKLKIWLISRIDQSVIIAEHLNKQGKLVQWDRFISFSEKNLFTKYLFRGTRRRIHRGIESPVEEEEVDDYLCLCLYLWV